MTDKYGNDRREDTGPTLRINAVKILSSWADTIISMPASLRIVASIMILALVTGLDALTESEISFSVFYLFPVVFAEIFVSRRSGYLMAFTSAAIWGYLDVTLGQSYSSAWIPFWNSGVRLGFFVIVIELIDMLQNEHEKTKRLSRTDALTGLANTRVFNERAYQVIEQSRRDGQPFTITYVDLDRFKQVNDDFGHSEGDQLLKIIASLIENCVRTTDVVARLGGDEFAILMPGQGWNMLRMHFSA